MRVPASVTWMVFLALRAASAARAPAACNDFAAVEDPLHPSAEVITSIQQTLALFPLAIDTRTWGLLSNVFTETAQVNFTAAPGDQPSGLPAIITWLQGFLNDVTSHHDLGGLHINQTNNCQAMSRQYLAGHFFGQGDLTGQDYLNYGWYDDELVKEGGASNVWRVQSRVLTAVVSVDPFTEVYDYLGLTASLSFEFAGQLWQPKRPAPWIVQSKRRSSDMRPWQGWGG